MVWTELLIFTTRFQREEPFEFEKKRLLGNLAVVFANLAGKTKLVI